MLSIFGEARGFDYSMLNVRGGYTTAEKLINISRYHSLISAPSLSFSYRQLQMVKWLSSVDFRKAGEKANVEELEAACALVVLMTHSQQVDSWFVCENSFTKLIG